MLAFVLFALTAAAISGQKPAPKGQTLGECVLKAALEAFFSEATSNRKLVRNDQKTPSELKQEFKNCNVSLSSDDEHLNVAVALASGLDFCCECIRKVEVYEKNKSNLGIRYRAVEISAHKHKANPCSLAHEVFEITGPQVEEFGCTLKNSIVHKEIPNDHVWLGAWMTIPKRDVVCVVRLK